MREKITIAFVLIAYLVFMALILSMAGVFNNTDPLQFIMLV